MSDKEYMKQWRKNNSERIKQYQKQYRKDHPEDIKEYQKKWNKDNSENVKEYRKQRYLRDREEELKRTKQWKKDNPEKVKKINNRFYQKHRKKRLEEGKQYRKNHPEIRKEYRKNHPEVRRQNRKAKLQYVQNYKLSKGCSICGYNKNPRSLGFHHTDDNKEYNISHAVAQDMSLNKIKEEMGKCIVLCNNCHSKLHWELREKKEKT